MVGKILHNFLDLHTRQPLPACLRCPTFEHITLAACEDGDGLMVYTEGPELFFWFPAEEVVLLGRLGKRALAADERHRGGVSENPE